MNSQASTMSVWLSISTGWIMRLLGLAAIVALVFWVADHKLSTLKSNNAAMPSGYVSMTEKFKQLECLTRNIYWEAASEPFEGKVAVAQVTMNRLKDGRFGSSVCNVVHQRSIIYQKVVCQFTWTCENTHKIRPVHPGMWQESEVVAQKVMIENFRLPSLQNALYYHADYVSPNWGKPRITKIGRHIFYSEGNRQ